MIFILIFVENCLKQDAVRVRIKNSEDKKIAEINKNNNNY